MPAASTSAMSKSAGPSTTRAKKRPAATPSGEEDLDALFEASIKAYEEAAQADKDKRHFSSTDDMIRLDDSGVVSGKQGDDNQRKAANGKQNAASTSQQGPAAAAATVFRDKGKRKAIDVHLDRLQSEKALSEFRGQGKREGQRKAREQRAQTAGSEWYDLPAFPTEDRSSSHGGPSAASSRYASSARGATAEEMKREVQAIRLRNAMDPKRFYKGGASKDKGMPAFAQLGKIIASPLEPKSYMTKAERGRTVVEELIKDAEAAAYAKRKYGEHQVKAAAGGRGHSKAKTKKPGDRKRQRR